MRNTFIAMMCTVVLVLPVAAQQRVDETRQVAADAVVTFEGVSGTVVVSGWDRAEVRVTGTLGRRIEKLEITGSISGSTCASSTHATATTVATPTSS